MLPWVAVQAFRQIDFFIFPTPFAGRRRFDIALAQGNILRLDLGTHKNGGVLWIIFHDRENRLLNFVFGFERPIHGSKFWAIIFVHSKPFRSHCMYFNNLESFGTNFIFVNFTTGVDEFFLLKNINWTIPTSHRFHHKNAFVQSAGFADLEIVRVIIVVDVLQFQVRLADKFSDCFFGLV